MTIKPSVEKLSEMNRFGLDWDHCERPFAKVSEELQEVKEAVLENDPNHLKEELGDLILASIDLTRYLGFDPEEALAISLKKLGERFEHYKKFVGDRNLNPQEMSFEERIGIWKESKKMHLDKMTSA